MEMVVIIRPGFKRFCGDDACRAALFNHLLYWIAQKAKGQSQDNVQRGEVSWYGTIEEIAAGLADSWPVSKVSKELKLLVKNGLVGQRRNPANKWDKTWHYFIGPEQGQAIREACQKHDVCLRDIGLKPDVLRLLSLVNGCDAIDAKLTHSSIEASENTHRNLHTDASILTDSGIDTSENADRNSLTEVAIPKVTAKVSSKDNNSKDTAKKEDEPPATQPSVSLFSQDEEEFLSWLKEKAIPRRKDVETVKQQIAFIRDRITTRDQLHRYCDYAIDAYRGKKNPNVALGNLASEWLLNGFLQAEKATQPFNTPAPLEMASQDDVETLAAEILREYPEIVLVFKTDVYGPYLEMPLSDDDSIIPEGARDMYDWQELRANSQRLAQVLAYGRRHCLVA
jgi:hypothetical protein